MGSKSPSPRCANCDHLHVGLCANVTGNNRGRGAHPRRPCHCEHPEAVKTFNKVCPRSPRMAGFIAYTTMNDHLPQIKTSPKWCPLRHQEAEAQK